MVLISRIAVLSIRDRLLLSGRVNEIEEGDLRFDAQDIGNYFAQCGYPISSEDISHLIYISEGWAAALYLNLVSYAEILGLWGYPHHDGDDFVRAIAAR